MLFVFEATGIIFRHVSVTCFIVSRPQRNTILHSSLLNEWSLLGVSLEQTCVRVKTKEVGIEKVVTSFPLWHPRPPPLYQLHYKPLHHIDDNNDEADKGTSRVSTPYPTTYVNSLSNDVP
ncbi:hypothetical protein Tco_1335684 [Tanacetum coccineum]